MATVKEAEAQVAESQRKAKDKVVLKNVQTAQVAAVKEREAASEQRRHEGLAVTPVARHRDRHDDRPQRGGQAEVEALGGGPRERARRHERHGEAVDQAER